MQPVFWPVRFNRSRISKRTHATSFQISRAVVAAAQQFDEAWICVKLWMTSVAVLKEEPAFIQSSLNWDLANKEKPKSQQKRSYRKSDYTGASRKPAVLFLITRIYETYEPDCSKYAKSGSIKHFLSASNAAQRPSRSSFCAIPASYLPVFWHMPYKTGYNPTTGHKSLCCFQNWLFSTSGVWICVAFIPQSVPESW